MDGVVTVMKSGGQYQVVIGNHVLEVFEDVMELLDLKEGDSLKNEKKSGKLLDRAIDVVSGIFQPVLGIMAACGMLKGLNALYVTLGLYSATCGGYMIINAAGEALHILFEGTMFASKCEKLFNRIVPDLVKFFFVPMLTLLVTLPIAILLLGPVATFGSTLISEFTLAVRGISPMLAGGIVGLTWQILVIFGMHWGFIPVYINNVMTLGYDNVMMPFFACTFATSAVVLAIFFKTKDRNLKKMAIPNNFRKFILGGMGILELPNMMNPDGTMGNIIVAFVGMAIAMVVGFVLTMIFYKDKPSEKIDEKTSIVSKANEIAMENPEKKRIVYSPSNGKVIPLSEVEDEAFSSGMLGQGVAIIPEEGILYAPADGEISAFFQQDMPSASRQQMEWNY